MKSKTIHFFLLFILPQSSCWALCPADRLIEDLKVRGNTGEGGKEVVPALGVFGVHDALSARILERQQLSTINKALFVSGFGVSACRLGLPDAGLVTSTEIEDSAKSIIQLSTSPVIVDGDTGFGGAANIRRTVRQMANIGAAAISIEDQEFPKKCTYVAGSGVTVLDRDEAKRRIQIALAAKKEAWEKDGNKILIIARTDCRMQLGLDEAVERCLAFEDAGADIVYSENLQSQQEYLQLRKKIDVTTPMMLAQVQTGKQDQVLWTLDEVGEMGYQMGLFGITGLQAAVAAMEQAASEMIVGSGLVSTAKLSSLDQVKEIVGFQELEAFEQELSKPEKTIKARDDVRKVSPSNGKGFKKEKSKNKIKGVSEKEDQQESKKAPKDEAKQGPNKSKGFKKEEVKKKKEVVSEKVEPKESEEMVTENKSIPIPEDEAIAMAKLESKIEKRRSQMVKPETEDSNLSNLGIEFESPKDSWYNER